MAKRAALPEGAQAYALRATDARLFRLLWLSVAAALATIAPKTGAWLLTGSVGLLSDAAESLVNLVAAIVALLALRWAAKPADEGHGALDGDRHPFLEVLDGCDRLIVVLELFLQASERLIDVVRIAELDRHR